MPDTLRQAGVKPYFKPKAVNMLITTGVAIYIEYKREEINRRTDNVNKQMLIDHRND